MLASSYFRPRPMPPLDLNSRTGGGFCRRSHSILVVVRHRRWLSKFTIDPVTSRIRGSRLPGCIHLELYRFAYPLKSSKTGCDRDCRTAHGARVAIAVQTLFMVETCLCRRKDLSISGNDLSILPRNESAIRRCSSHRTNTTVTNTLKHSPLPLQRRYPTDSQNNGTNNHLSHHPRALRHRHP